MMTGAHTYATPVRKGGETEATKMAPIHPPLAANVVAVLDGIARAGLGPRSRPPPGPDDVGVIGEGRRVQLQGASVVIYLERCTPTIDGICQCAYVKGKCADGGEGRRNIVKHCSVFVVSFKVGGVRLNCLP